MLMFEQLEAFSPLYFSTRRDETTDSDDDYDDVEM